MALEAEVRAKGAAKLGAMQAELDQAQVWIEGVTGEPFAQPFAEELKDGAKLCNFINGIKAGSVKKVNASKLAFKQMENITNFLKAAKGMGLGQNDVFDTIDLYEARDLTKVVMCLHSFGAIISVDAAKYGFSGPFLETSVKMATQNKREYTQEQMAAQRAMAGTTAINAGSAGVMERSEVKKGGITFGNDNAGAGDAGLSAQTAGSAGVMERSEVKKGGITFGNEQAGAGTADLTAQTAGSAGVMERSEVTSQGITFGNSAAGAGDAGMTAQTAGSAGVMERSETTKQGIAFGAAAGSS